MDMDFDVRQEKLTYQFVEIRLKETAQTLKINYLDEKQIQE